MRCFFFMGCPLLRSHLDHAMEERAGCFVARNYLCAKSPEQVTELKDGPFRQGA